MFCAVLASLAASAVASRSSVPIVQSNAMGDCCPDMLSASMQVCVQLSPRLERYRKQQKRNVRVAETMNGGVGRSHM